MSKSLCVWVLSLMRKICEFLGLRRTVKTAELTRQFMKQRLSRLSSRINELANQALSATLADGRGVWLAD